MRKFAKYGMQKIMAFALIFLLALCSSFCVSQIAFAIPVDSNFEMIFPTKNYYQFTENSIVAADDDTFAVFNPLQKQITVFDASTYLLPCSEATSLVLFGDFLFAKNSLGYEQFDLTTKTSLGNATLTDAPENYKLYANGNTLFAINDFGSLRSYNTDLETISTENSTLLVDSTLAVKNNIVYSLDYSTSINKFILQSLDFSNTPSTVAQVLVRDVNYTHLSVADYIYIAFSKENSTALTVYDLDGDLQLSQNFDFKIKSIHATQGGFWFLDDPTTTLYRYNFKVENDTLSLDLDKIITNAYGDNFHLNSPADVAKFGNKTYIADKDNNRLITLTSTDGTSVITTLTMQSPKGLIAFENGVYVATANKITVVYGDKIVNEYSLSGVSPIISIAKTDKLYALSNNKIYVLSDNTFKEFKTVQNAKKLTASTNGNIVYVLTDTQVLAFSENGDNISTDIAFSKDTVVDFDIDFVGNLFVITSSGKIAEYSRGLLEYTFSKDITLSHNIFETGLPQSLSIGNDGKLYFCTDKNFVASTESFSPQIKDSFTPTAKPKITKDTKIYTAKLNADSFFLLDYKNYEYVQKIGKGTVVACFRDLSKDENFVYLIHGSNLGYISASNLQEMTQAKPKAYNVKTLHPTAKIYDYPLNQPSTPYQTVPKGTELEIVSDVSGFANPLKWYKVKYGIDKTGYIFTADVTDSNDAVLTSGNPVYAKARASRIGEKVSIYALPDSMSTVLDRVTDGAELQVLDDSTYDDYIKIKYGGIVGYVKSSEVKFDGMTYAQIIALVLVCVTAVVAVAIFFVTYRIKRKAD